jgi:uncharacterized protein YjeT (DUF2065 family)
MSEFATALGLVLVIEGLLYAVAPQGLKRMMSVAQTMSDDQMRTGGMIAIALGVAIVWLGRSLFSAV